jgi:hypothetical protein
MINISELGIIPAKYTDQTISQYKGNPLIEALPDIIDDPQKLTLQLTSYPSFSKSDIELPAIYRIHLVKNIENYFKPLSVHYSVEQIISRMLRNGYVNRNPVKTSNQTLNYTWQKYPLEEVTQSTTPELGIFGISGIGKTTLIKKILSLYPKVILHTDYKGNRTIRYQITWLLVQTPSNGSPKSLCLNLLSQIDEIFKDNAYYKKGANKNTDELPEYIKTVVKQHSIGLLVFDELQNLRGIGGKKEEQLLNFFVELSNTIEVPIIMIGTLKALPLFNTEFRNSRRICGEENIIWNRIENDAEWKSFIGDLFNFQWTKHKVEVTNELTDLLYDQSQGITDIAIKIFMLSQYRAISTGTEKITRGIVKSVAKDSLKPILPMLDALRRNDEEDLKNFGDIYFKKEDWDNITISEQNKALMFGNSNKLDITLQNNDEFTKHNKITSVTTWLVQGGYSLKDSEATAREVIEKLGASTDLNTLNRHAYTLLIDKADNKSKETDLSKNKVTLLKEPSGMLLIFEKALNAKHPIYEALRNNNYIAEINEFIS